MKSNLQNQFSQATLSKERALRSHFYEGRGATVRIGHTETKINKRGHFETVVQEGMVPLKLQGEGI